MLLQPATEEFLQVHDDFDQIIYIAVFVCVSRYILVGSKTRVVGWFPYLASFTGGDAEMHAISNVATHLAQHLSLSRYNSFWFFCQKQTPVCTERMYTAAGRYSWVGDQNNMAAIV